MSAINCDCCASNAESVQYCGHANSCQPCQLNNCGFWGGGCETLTDHEEPVILTDDLERIALLSRIARLEDVLDTISDLTQGAPTSHEVLLHDLAKRALEAPDARL